MKGGCDEKITSRTIKMIAALLAPKRVLTRFGARSAAPQRIGRRPKAAGHL